MSEMDYTPDGLREGGRGSHRSANSAETSRDHLRRVSADSSHFGGAAEFTSAVNSTRDVQSRGVERAAEDRDAMGESSAATADVGEDVNLDAERTMRLGSPVARQVADGM